MLLIAQPKSASTSLACTISKIGHLRHNLGVPYDSIDIDCKGFEEIQKYHDNMVERSPIFLKQVITGRKTIFKEHLLPTDRHLRILEKFRKHKIIILLRLPEDSCDSYNRMGLKQNYSKEKMLDDLSLFHDRYMWWDSRQPNTKIVYYRDLILNYDTVIKNVLNWYRIKGKIFPLLKYKYTKVGEKRLKCC